MVEALTTWLDQHGDQPFFVHASFIRPHPPRRNPAGYHDLYDADDLPPFVATPTKAEEAAAHPLNQALMYLPLAGAPEDESERRQMRATYHGAQKEVDDQLARLFHHLDASGLAESTLVVLTSDHGEMGGDHWLFEKLGYWDESFHVPLIVRDPDPAASAGRGRVVHAFTESVDVLPTICCWLGPRRTAAGGRLRPAAVHHRGRAARRSKGTCRGRRSIGAPKPIGAGTSPIRSPGLPSASSDCPWPTAPSMWSAVQGRSTSSSRPRPPSCRRSSSIWSPTRSSCTIWWLAGGASERGWQAAQRLTQWRMRNDDRTLTGTVLTATDGVVSAVDEWR